MREIAEAARSTEPDRYLAALLAPRAARDDLIVLAAFLGEIGRIPWLVSEPMLGEIRLQWWRDAIEAFGGDVRTGNPLADALGEVAARRGLDIELLRRVVDACAMELDTVPVPDSAALARYLAGRDGAGFRLAARILGAAGSETTDAVLTAAGEAYGRARLLRHLPRQLASGRLMLPLDWPEVKELRDSGPLDASGGALAGRVAARLAGTVRARMAELQALQGDLSRDHFAAILPCALVEPYLRALEGYDFDHGQDRGRLDADIAPMTRVWRLWRAHRRARV